MAGEEDTTSRPFRLEVPEEDVAELRRRIAATRWPDRETVNDRSQGAQLGKIQELVARRLRSGAALDARLWLSAKPQGAGWNPDRIGRAWRELMDRLGYQRYVSQGRDWGRWSPT